jgi:Rab GDP dissociation inhibitor
MLHQYRSFFLRNSSADSLVILSKLYNIDVYISMVSSAHAVCAKGLFIAMISTTVETDNPENEIKPALELLGNVLEMFVNVSPLYVPTDNGSKDNVFVTKSYDATSHFEEATDEILELYTRITGERLDMNIEPTDDEEY